MTLKKILRYIIVTLRKEWMNMKKLVEKDVIKELENIYGIENCKGEIWI